MKLHLSNPPAKGAVSFEVSVCLQGRGGDLTLFSGEQVEEERGRSVIVHKKDKTYALDMFFSP